MTAVKVKAYLLRYTVLSNANFDRAYEIVRKKKREREKQESRQFSIKVQLQGVCLKVVASPTYT